jgi:signal transduction histidine kinase
MFDAQSQVRQAFTHSSYNGFVDVHTSDHYQHFALGQISGSLNEANRSVAWQIKAVIAAESQQSIQEQLTQVCDLREAMAHSCDMFIGKIDQHLPMLYYAALGDITVVIIRKNKIISLESQSFSLSQTQLPHIHYHAIKLLPNDLIVVITQTLPEVMQTSMLAHNHDADMQGQIASCISADQSLLLWRYPGMSNLPQRPHINDYLLVHQDVVPELTGHLQGQTQEWLKHRHDTSDRTAPLPRLSSSEQTINDCALPDSGALFYQFAGEAKGRGALTEICAYLAIPEHISRRLQLVIMETARAQQTSIPIYVTNQSLYVQFPKGLTHVEALKSLLPAQYLKRETVSAALCFVYPMSGNIDVAAQVHIDMQQRLRLGLSATEYQQYVTEKAHDQRLLQQAKLAAMGEMVGSIAHQWRQPLNELAIRIQMVPYAFHKADDLETYLTKFIEENLATIDFMSQTIDDFRNFFRTDKAVEPFAMSAVIGKTLELLNGLVEKHHIKIELDVSDQTIEGVQSELQQVLMNLLHNSIDALNSHDVANKTIRVSWKHHILKIHDNGGGIPSDELMRIFEPYFTTKAHGQGTGLGLYMSKLIIEQSFQRQLQITNDDFVVMDPVDSQNIGGSRAYRAYKGACATIRFD